MTGRVAWHRDPENPDRSRLWDGTAWTECVAFKAHAATIAVSSVAGTQSRPPEDRGQVPSVSNSIDVASAPSLGTSESIDESDWFLRQFTPQQLRHINEVLADDVGTRLQGPAPSVLESMSGLVVAFDNPRDRDQYGIPILERLVDLLCCVDAARVTDIQALHFTFQVVIQSAYKLRDRPGWFDIVLWAAYSQVALAQRVASAMRREYGASGLPGHVGYERLVIVMDKVGCDSAVIRLAQQAQMQGWAGEWTKRIQKAASRSPQLASPAAEPMDCDAATSVDRPQARPGDTPEPEPSSPRSGETPNTTKGPSMSDNSTPANWYPDPQGRHEYRYWDGVAWTQHVSDRGVVTADPIAPVDPQATRAGLDVSRGSGGQQVADAAPVDHASDRDVVSVATSSSRDLDTLLAGVSSQPARGGRFGRGRAEALEADNEELRTALAELGVFQRQQLTNDLANLRSQLTESQRELADVQREVIETRERAILQEVGVYEFRHPLDDSDQYKARLDETRERMKGLVKQGNAVVGVTEWRVNGSAKEGARMVRDTGKLMLRAYNNEADNCVRTLKPYTLDAAITRLTKARETIARLGKIMQIRVTDDYHRLRVYELELTADYLARVAEEKERAREERARLRDEEIAQREFKREHEKLEKELAHRQNVLAALQASGDTAAIAEAEAKLAEVTGALTGLQERAANTRAGFVYVISNFGAFGERMVKIGMTRRLEPRDRITELGDASVPFRYDTHLLMFHEDAVWLEHELHRLLDDRRVNRVNARREFFYATPVEVRELLHDLDVALLEFVEVPEALEWRQSITESALNAN